MDTDSFVLSVNAKDFINFLKNFEDIFDSSKLDEKHELFNNKDEKEWEFSKSRVLKIFGLMNLFV